MVDLGLAAVPRAGVVHHRRAAEGVRVWIIGSCLHHTLLRGKIRTDDQTHPRAATLPFYLTIQLGILEL